MEDLSNRRADGGGPTFSTLIDGSIARRQRGHFRRRKSSLQRRRFPSRGGDTIPGSAGTDFPDFRSIPLTRFSCLDGGPSEGSRKPGFYADVETQCQVSLLSAAALGDDQ